MIFEFPAIIFRIRSNLVRTTSQNITYISNVN